HFLDPLVEAQTATFDGCTTSVPGTGIEFEVISPINGSGFVQGFLDANGPGLHHITLEVPDIRELANDLEKLGITPFGGIVDDGEWYVTYIHPRDSGGILWQIEEDHRADFTPTEPPPVRGVIEMQRIDHVSMCVADLEGQIAW